MRVTILHNVTETEGKESPEFLPQSHHMKSWLGGMEGWIEGCWLGDGAGLISEGLGLMGSVAVGETVQTRHIVCRKSV